MGLALILILSAVALYQPARSPDYPIPGDGDRITVEVLNGAAVDGLARETTRRLRARGIDVVYFGTARDSVWKTTEVIVRRGDTSVGRVVQTALGGGVVVERPDPRLLLDITVILGTDLGGSSPDSGRLDP